MMLVLQAGKEAAKHSKAIVRGAGAALGNVIKGIGGAFGGGGNTRRRRLSYDDRKWMSTEIVMANVAQVLADDCRSVLITPLSARLCNSKSFPTCRLKVWYSKPRSVQVWRSFVARCVNLRPMGRD